MSARQRSPLPRRSGSKRPLRPQAVKKPRRYVLHLKRGSARPRVAP